MITPGTVWHVQIDDWTDGITIEVLAARFTPQQAARIKAKVFMLRVNTDQESLNFIDPIHDQDGAHRWFVYCLDVVARRA